MNGYLKVGVSLVSDLRKERLVIMGDRHLCALLDPQEPHLPADAAELMHTTLLMSWFHIFDT